MAGKNTAVFGIYPNRTSIDSAVDALKAAEFRNTDISVLFPESAGTKDFAHDKSTKAPEGATTGAGTGALLGGGLGWLVGIGALAIPGLGPFIAAGPIMAALAGSRSGWRSRWDHRSFDRHGNPGVRSQAIRRPRQRWRDSALRSLRRFRVDQESEGNLGAHRAPKIFPRRVKRAPPKRAIRPRVREVA
jgi:hypothetical protein